MDSTPRVVLDVVVPVVDVVVEIVVVVGVLAVLVNVLVIVAVVIVCEVVLLLQHETLEIKVLCPLSVSHILLHEPSKVCSLNTTVASSSHLCHCVQHLWLCFLNKCNSNNQENQSTFSQH